MAELSVRVPLKGFEGWMLVDAVGWEHDFVLPRLERVQVVNCAVPDLARRELVTWVPRPWLYYYNLSDFRFWVIPASGVMLPLAPARDHLESYAHDDLDVSRARIAADVDAAVACHRDPVWRGLIDTGMSWTTAARTAAAINA